MKPDHFPYRVGDNITLLTYTGNGPVIGQFVDADEHGVTLFHIEHQRLAWRPWGNISGAYASVPPVRVAELISNAAQRAAREATGVQPAPVDTTDAPPPA